jgi:transcriptional regulator with XRE-family HTH domain
MYDRQLIANRIYMARKDKYLKQEDVGNALGIKQSSYSDLETGKRDMTVPELLTLADLFDVPVTWLLDLNRIPQLTDKECLEVENYIKYLISKRNK